MGGDNVSVGVTLLVKGVTKRVLAGLFEGVGFHPLKAILSLVREPFGRAR
jgi:hypothetical protein